MQQIGIVVDVDENRRDYEKLHARVANLTTRIDAEILEFENDLIEAVKEHTSQLRQCLLNWGGIAIDGVAELEVMIQRLGAESHRLDTMNALLLNFRVSLPTKQQKKRSALFGNQQKEKQARVVTESDNDGFSDTDSSPLSKASSGCDATSEEHTSISELGKSKDKRLSKTFSDTHAPSLLPPDVKEDGSSTSSATSGNGTLIKGRFATPGQKSSTGKDGGSTTDTGTADKRVAGARAIRYHAAGAI